MKNILITGFEKFGDYKENITETFTNRISQINNYAVKSKIFPVRIFENGAENYGEQVIELAQEIKAKSIISLGMASDIKGVRIESKAKNWVENEKYCIPSEQKRLIDDSLPPKTTLEISLKDWDIDQIFHDLEENNIVFEPNISTDAYFFCCNALMFRILQSMKKQNLMIPYLFLHVPCSSDSIKGIVFDTKKHLTSVLEIENILEIFLKHLNHN